MVENFKIAIFIAGAVSLGSGLIIFLLLRYLRRQDERLKLIMKTIYLNTKGMKTVGEKIEMICLEQQNGFDSQRKSFDHQRVLASSLNRQLKHIEAALFNGGNLDPTGGDQVDLQDTHVPPEDAGGNSSTSLPGSAKTHYNGEIQPEKIARRKGVTLLKSLLQEKRLQSREVSDEQQKAEKLTAIFENNFQLNDEPRRAVNG